MDAAICKNANEDLIVFAQHILRPLYQANQPKVLSTTQRYGG